MSRRHHRALLLSGLLEQAHDAPTEGAYSPHTHARQVLIGNDGGSAVAHMVSWHESFHSYLNASTCHGDAMMLVGALAAVGFEGFESLVERLLDASLTTHETYATVSGLSAAGGGPIDPHLLAGYPDYQPLLESFTDLFPSVLQPLLSVMALKACARAAMQTPIYDALIARPCKAWPSVDLGSVGNPDQRFAHLMISGTVERALDAMKAVLREVGGAHALVADQRLEPISALQVWRSSSTDMLDRVSTAAFDVFAEVLRQRTGHVARADGHKDGLTDLVASVEAFAGDRLQRQFKMPESREEDEVALFADFRNEHLILSDRLLPATFVGLTTVPDDIADLFVFEADGYRYCQFVAMPVEKWHALYAPISGKESLSQGVDGLIAGLRRRWAPPGTNPQVEVLVLQPDTASAVLKRLSNAAVELGIVCSLTLLTHTNWLLEWLKSSDCPANRMCVLIDDDCIDLIVQHAKRGAELQFAYLKARSAESSDEYIEILCIAADDEPDLLYFTPCTTPFRQAIIEYAERRLTQVSFERAFLRPWLPVLERLISHTLREESQFGDRFWI